MGFPGDGPGRHVCCFRRESARCLSAVSRAARVEKIGQSEPILNQRDGTSFVLPSGSGEKCNPGGVATLSCTQVQFHRYRIMYALEARSGPPLMGSAAVALGKRSQLNMLQRDAGLSENTQRGMEIRGEKPVYFTGRDVILIVLGEPMRPAI
jgi:hypothetical protein